MKTNKSIWVVTYNFGSFKTGPVIRFMRYAKLFEDKGYTVLFLTKLRINEQEQMENEDGIKSLHFDCDSIISLNRLALDKAIKSKIKPAAIIFFNLGYQNYWHFRKAKRAGLRLIYVSTMSLNLERNGQQMRSFIRRKALSVVLKKLYSLMDYVVSSTSNLQEDFHSLSIPKNKLKIIYNGVNTEKFSLCNEPDKKEIRRALGVPPGKFVFLYVGLFVDRKGVDDLIETFKELHLKSKQRVILLMVGHEMETNENSQEFTKNWPLLKTEALKEGWLLIHPFSNKIEQYYKASNAFVFMSKLEGMPNVILEGMSSGLPILTTKFDGFGDDYGEEGKHFLVFKRDKAKDSYLLEQLINNPKKLGELSKAARSQAIESFDIQKSINNYISLLNY